MKTCVHRPYLDPFVAGNEAIGVMIGMEAWRLVLGRACIIVQEHHVHPSIGCIFGLKWLKKQLLSVRTRKMITLLNHEYNIVDERVQIRFSASKSHRVD